MVYEEDAQAVDASHYQAHGAVSSADNQRDPYDYIRKTRTKTAYVSMGLVVVGFILCFGAGIMWVLPYNPDGPTYIFEVNAPFDEIVLTDWLTIFTDETLEFIINLYDAPIDSTISVRVCYESGNGEPFDAEARLAPLIINDDYGTPITVQRCQTPLVNLPQTAGLIVCPDEWGYAYVDVTYDSYPYDNDIRLYLLMTTCEESVDGNCSCPADPYEGQGLGWILFLFWLVIICSCCCCCFGCCFCIAGGALGVKASTIKTQPERQYIVTY